MPDRPRPAHQ